MSQIQFILGRSGTGKTRWCIDAVCDALSAGGDEPLILLVPEQATYQAERAILSHPDIAGFSRLHILSFNRLQFWLGGAQNADEISHTGKQMVLHKLLLEMGGQLRLYKGDIRRLGLAGQLSSLIGELQRSCCTAKQVQLLAQTLANQPGQEMAAAKWADIAQIFEAYEAFFEHSDGAFANPDIGLTQVRQNVADASFLRGAKLWVDGFSGFSVQERELLIELLKVCTNASIALCLNPETADLTNTDQSKLDPCSLFAATEETYCDLRGIMDRCKFQVQPPVILDRPFRFEQAPALGALEQSFIDADPAVAVSADGSISITACQNIRAEATSVAAQIHQLVKDPSYRYRDIAVVVPDMNTYQHYIESAFSEYGLPYFMDRPRQMKTHPLTELIASALQAVAGRFALSDILSFLKSGMTGADFDAIDALENYCRAFDVSGTEWLAKAAWDFAPPAEKQLYNEPSLDTLRRDVMAPLVALHQSLDADETISAHGFVCALWDFLDAIDAAGTLSRWAAEDIGDEQFGHRQLYAKVVELAEEMCQVFEGVTLGADSWGSIFVDALSSLTIKLIPPTLDQVLVGSIERSRHPDVKAIFLIGVTQKQFPIPTSGQMLLSEQDYQYARDQQLELPNPYEQQLTHRQYLAYIALSRASKAVYLSYPMLDEKGSTMIPWSHLDQLQKRFSDLQVHYTQSTIDDPGQIHTPTQLTQWLCAKLGKDRDTASGDGPGDYQQVAAGVLEKLDQSGDAALSHATNHVKRALGYDNNASLTPQTAAQMFSFPMNTSTTRLSTFAACPYQYFAKYSLNLKRRQLLRFEPMDIGNFYHEVLEKMFNALRAAGKDWADLADEQLIALCDEQIESVLAENTQIANFIRRQAHHRYILESAKEVLRRFVPALATLSRASAFKQVAAEKEFGLGDSPPMVITLDDGRVLHLRGKIDRMDMADIKGAHSAVVFDFKRTSKSPDFAGMLYGLDLQLPLYLLAIQRVGGDKTQSPVSVGAFFLPIETGFATSPLSKLGQADAKFGKAKGLFDGRFAGDIDADAAPSQWSRYYNFYLNKDGAPYSHYGKSGALKDDDFQTLLRYTEACIRKLAAEQAAGRIEIKPYRLGKKSPCSYCDYKPLCRFDWQVNEYNILDTCDKEEALEKMKERLR